MIRLSVYYPRSDGAAFDHDYYRLKHVPLVCSTWGVAGPRLERGIRGPYEAVLHLDFESLEAVDAAMQHEGTAEIMADLVNYTTITPVMQTSEIVPA